MADENEVDIVVEADASAVVSSTEQAVAAFSKMLDQVKSLENNLAQIFTRQLPMGVQQVRQLAEAMREIERIPTLPANQVARNQAVTNGQTGSRLSSQGFSQAMRELRADPAMQGIRYEEALNKQLEAREQLYRRIAAAMPGATQGQLLEGYRQSLGRLGANPANAGVIGGTEEEMAAARARRQKFFADTEAETRLFNDKMQAEYLAEEAQKFEKTNLLYEQMMRRRAAMMTPEEAEQRAQRLSDYASRRGQTVDQGRLIAAYQDEHARQTAITGRDLSQPRSEADLARQAEDRVRQRVAMREAQLNYQGGAPMFGVEAHTMANYALMGSAIGGVAYAGKSVVDFQNGLDGVKSEAGATDGAMSSLAKNIMAVGSASSQSLADLTAAIDLLVKAGYGVQEAGQMLKPVSQLATVTKSSAKDAADVVTEVMKTYNVAASETPMITNALAEIATKSKVSLADVGTAFKSAGQFAQASGMQFNEVLAAFGAMAAAGMKDGSQLGTGLRSLIEALDNPTTKLRAQLEKVGLTAADVNVQANGLGGALENMRTHGLTSAEAMAGLQARAFQAYNALSQNVDVFNQLDKSVLSSTAATESATQRMESLDGQWQRFLNNLTNFAYEASGPLLHSLTALVDVFASVLGVASKLGPVLGVVGTVLGALAASTVLVWVGNLAMGFIKWTGAIESANLALGLSAAQTAVEAVAIGELDTALVAGTLTVRAFGAALLATPLGWLTLGITAVTLGLELFNSAQGNAAKQVEDYGRKVEEAGAKQQEYKSRIGELDGYIASLIDRHEALSKNTTLVGQAAEIAAQKFGAWGLQIDAQTAKVDGLIDRLIELRRQQAGQQLNALQDSNAALTKKDQGLDQQIGHKIFALQHDQNVRFGAYGPNVTSAVDQLNSTNARDISLRLRNTGAPQSLIDQVDDVAHLTGQRESDKFQLAQNQRLIPQLQVQSSPQFAAISKQIATMAETQKADLTEAMASKDPDKIRAALTAANQRYDQAQQLVKPLGGVMVPGMDQLSAQSIRSTPQTTQEWNARHQLLMVQARAAKTPQERQQYIDQANTAHQNALRASPNFDPLGTEADDVAQTDALKGQKIIDGKDKTADILKDQAKDILKQMQEKVGVGTTPEAIQAQQPELQKMAASYTDLSRRAIQAEGGADMSAKLKDFDTTSKEAINKILEGNIAAAQKLIADASKSAATDRGKTLATNAKNGTLGNMDAAIQSIQSAYAQAVSDQADYLKSSYLRDHPGASGLEVSAKTAEDIKKATDSLGQAAAKAVVAVIDGVRDATLRSMTQEARQSQVLIGQQRTSIAAAHNPWGEQHISAAHDFVLQQAGQQLDVQEALNNQTVAHAELASSGQALNALKGQYNQQFAASNGSEQANAQLNTLQDAITKAQAEFAKLQQSVVNADAAVQKLTEHTQPLTNAGQAMSAAWAQFSNQAHLDEPMWEQMSTGIGGVLNTTHQGFQNLFKDLVTGTTSANNAFRQLGISIFNSIADAASKALADQAVKALFSMLGAGGNVNPIGDILGGPNIAASVPSLGPLTTQMPSVDSFFSGFVPGLWQGGLVRRAQGGMMGSGVPTRDSIPTILAPGEFVMNQDAVSMIGADTLDNLNSAGNSVRSNTPTLAQAMPQREPDQVNVWVAAPEAQPQMGPKDIVAAVTNDILTNGQTKRLIQAVQLGVA